MNTMPLRKLSNRSTESVQKLPQIYNIMEPLKVISEISFTTKKGIT